MATKTTSQTLDEKQLEIYHSFLILAERRILLAAKNDSTTINSVLEDIQKDLTKNKDIKSLPKSFKETLTKTIKTAAIISKNCQPPSPYMALNIMRNNRKKFDSEYIKNLIYSTTNPTDEKISQIKAFFQQVKEDDPLYLDKLIATTLEHFKSIPSSFKYKKDDATQRYTVSQEHKTMILNAQRIINQVVTGYKINTKEFPEPKHYALCVMDRILFNGAIYEAPKTNKYSKFPTSQEAINVLKQQLEPNGDYENDKNAHVIIHLFEEYMKKNKLEKAPFPKQINNMIEEFKKLPPKYNGNNITFQKVEFDKIQGKYTYTTNRFLQDFYFKTTGKILKTSDIKPGVKYHYHEQIEKDEKALALMCEGMEQYMLQGCEKYKLDKKVILAVFANYKFDDNGKIKKDYSKNLYHHLINSGFTPSLHHDNLRIRSDKNPNHNKDNFILTIIPAQNHSFTDIYEKFIDTLELGGLNKKDQLKTARKDAQNIKKEQTIETESIHSDIFHGADLYIAEENSTDNSYLSFYFTPTNDNEQKNNSGRIIAIVKTAAPIYDKEPDGKTSKDIIEELHKKTLSNQKIYLSAKKDYGLNNGR